MGKIRVRLLGGFEVASDRGALEIPSRKNQALLAYLAMTQRPSLRSRVADLLWGDIAADEQARRSLRQALTGLRRALPKDLVRATRDTVALAEGVYVDAREIEHRLTSGELEDLKWVADAYRGDFLEGFDARAEGFDTWAEGQRRRLRALCLDAMQRLCERQRAVGNASDALPTAMRLVALDPLRESAQRTLMSLFADSGRHAEALRQYEECRDLLAREIGAAPGPETVALARTISGRNAASAAPAPRAESELRQGCVVLASRLNGALPVATIVASVERWGGVVVNHSTDEVCVAFGVTRGAHESVEQGLACTLKLRDELRRAGSEVAFALTSGQLLVDHDTTPPGLRGAPLRAVKSLGPKVAGVVVSHAVYAALAPRLQASRCERAETPSWMVESLAAKPTPLSRTPFVGRQFELAQLRAAMETCMQLRRGHCFVIRGDAGIGKTRLAEAAFEMATERDWATFCHAFIGVPNGIDDGGLASLVAQLAELPVGATPANVDAGLELAVDAGRVAVADRAAVRAMLLGEIAHPDLALDVAKRYAGVEARLLRARSKIKPVLVWLEDAQHAGPLARERVSSVMEAAMQERILVVLTTRGSGGSTEPPFPVSAGATVFDLGPLSGSDTRWLARWLDGSVGDERRAALVERAGGNPLFLAELLRHGGTGDHVPESAWAAVQARMDSATESVRRAAHIAAVLGPRVKPDAFSAIASDAASLEELSAVGLGREHIGGWRFHHALFYEAIYASIVDTRRAELHAMAARYYRERDEVAWAHHLERAGSKEAASAFAAAAESQRRVGAFAQVLALVERGIAPGTLPAVRLTLELLRASALNGLGRASDALEALAQAAPLAAQQNDQVRLELERAASLRALDRQTDALEALAYAEAGARATRATTLLAEIEYQRGSVLFPIGDVDGSLRAHRASIEHARTAGAANVEARALSGVGDAHYAAGRISEARESFCQAEELAGSLGMTRLALSAEGMQAVMIAFDLDLARCVRRCLDVAGRAQSIDALHVELFTRCGACFALVCMARWQELHAEASRATALAKAIGARRFEALARGYSSLAHARAGRIVEGETQLELARALRDDSGPAFSDGMLVAAELALVVDVARKRELVLSGLERLRPPSMFHSTLMSLVAFLGTAIELGDQELLRACVSLPRPQQPVPLWQLVHDIGAALTDGAPTGANAPRASVAGTRARAERAQFGVLGNDGHLTGTEP